MTEHEKMMDKMSEEDLYEYRRNLLKDTFTEEDFLSCDITRQRLVNEHFWEWEKNCAPKVEEFYDGMRERLQGNSSTPLFYDIHGTFSSDLNVIVYNHTKREYDLSIFYDCPDLANPLINRYDEIMEGKKDALNRVKKQNYGAGIKSTKKFDWATKTYK